jgi:probable F420-dependent oxidoreductase
VAIAFARSPMTCANVGWDLAASTGGRFTLGLGSQVRAHNERRFSVPWSPPAPRMREYVQAVRAIWAAWKADGKLNYEGKHYRFTLMTPNFTPEAFDGPTPRIGLAAVGPVMLKVAAEKPTASSSSFAPASISGRARCRSSRRASPRQAPARPSRSPAAVS